MQQKLPPGPRVSLFQLLTKSHNVPLSDVVEVGKLLASFGDISCATIGPIRMYWINNPQLAHLVLVEQAAKFQKPALIKKSLEGIFGNGIFTSDGNFWKRQRKLMQPAFHFKRLETYCRGMVVLTQQLAQTWRDGAEREIEHDMSDLTLQIVAHTLFSSDLSEDSARLRAVRAVFSGSENFQPGMLPDWIPTPSRQRMKKAMRELDHVVQQMIDSHRQNETDRGDLLSMLLLARDEDSGEQMTDQQVRDEVMTIFIAGQETVASLLTWVWYLLSQHPEVEEKLLAELRTVLGGRPPTFSNALPYTDMIIKEALRLYPPSSGIGREAAEDLTIGDYSVKKGAIVSVGIYTMHHDARYFENPEQFIPERFSKENESQIQPYTYFPFGGGPRICIGNAFALIEARLVIATLAQNYQLSLLPGQEIVPRGGATLRPHYGLRMKIGLREAPIAK